MARLIDCSRPDVVRCDVKLGAWGKLKFQLFYGWKSYAYDADDIVSVDLIDEERYRSAGGAAAGALIGGVLTGGLGLIAGAAIGGRRRRRAAFLVRFNDGHHVAFEDGQSAVVTVLTQINQRDRARAMSASANDCGDMIEAKPIYDPPTQLRVPVPPPRTVAPIPVAPQSRGFAWRALRVIGWTILVLFVLLVAAVVALLTLV